MTIDEALHDEWFRKNISKYIVLNCFRNTKLEDLHTGTFPSSKNGHFTDITVKSPYGKMTWDKVSRISDEEMKELLKDCVNSMYTMLTNLANPSISEHVIEVLNETEVQKEWDEPKLVTTL